MKILLVDDEPLVRKRLRRLIKELGSDYEVVGEADNGNSAVPLCISQHADLVLIDMPIPGIDESGTTKSLAELNPPPTVILMTGQRPLTGDGISDQTSGSLVKPVGRARLREVLERVRMNRKPGSDNHSNLEQPQREHLSAHYRGALQTVAVADVIFLQAEQKYVTVCYPDGKLLLDESLKALEEEFPQQFVRIHRSALVSCKHLLGLEKKPDGGNLAVLGGTDQRLPVSRRHLPKVRRFLRSH